MNDIFEILPVRNEKILISKKQKVNDIIREVLNSHAVFEQDYLLIADYFYAPKNIDIFKNLFDFCKEFLEYQVEPEEQQTTKSPAAILRTTNDCKHYAGFIGGVLNAINTKYNKKIQWWYRFASYNFLNSIPSHVFIVAVANDKEIWIDPVLKRFNDHGVRPIYYQDKKLKRKKMLQRISGVNEDNFSKAVIYLNYLGILSPTSFNREKYIQALETASEQEKNNLRNAYVIFKTVQNKIGDMVSDVASQAGSTQPGSIWSIIGGVLKGIGGALAPAPPPPPPVVQPVSTTASLTKYLPYVLIAGVGIFAVIELTKK